MIVAGIDVGAESTKAVILKKEKLVGRGVVPTYAQPEAAARKAMDEALADARVKFKKIKFCVATGWGRKKVGFAGKAIGEVPCLAKGASSLVPSAKTIIDVGAQTSTVINLNDRGKVLDYATNEKCAAGTGKFLGIIAEALELEIDEIGPLSLQSKNMVSLSNQCVVFAESEIISHVNEGADPADVMAGVNHSVASRLVTQARRVGFKGDVLITGGVAKNVAVVNNLSRMLETNLKQTSLDPQIIGAYGAALVAKDKA